MSGRTWVMMSLLLAINWGGFIGALVYGMRRDSRRRSTRASD